jgi:hypothetical protein
VFPLALGTIVSAVLAAVAVAGKGYAILQDYDKTPKQKCLKDTQV